MNMKLLLSEQTSLWAVRVSKCKKIFFSRQFLFKPGGTSPMYCTTSPGYPLTSSTVYSPPPRPLPRNTFSRPAFSLKKPYKHCNWKCAALSAILISVTLLFLLAYFIGESPLILPHTSVGSSTYPPQLHPPTLLQTQSDWMPFLFPQPSFQICLFIYLCRIHVVLLGECFQVLIHHQNTVVLTWTRSFYPLFGLSVGVGVQLAALSSYILKNCPKCKTSLMLEIEFLIFQ